MAAAATNEVTNDKPKRTNRKVNETPAPAAAPEKKARRKVKEEAPAPVADTKKPKRRTAEEIADAAEPKQKTKLPNEGKTNGAAPARKVSPEGMTTLADLCTELEIDPAKARRTLRAKQVNEEKGDGFRYAWKTGSKDLAAVRKILDAS